MIYLLSALLMISILIIIYLSIKSRRHHRDLDYLSIKIHSIIENKTEEKVKVFTDNGSLKSLMKEINDLIEEKNHSEADKHHYTEAMRKMLANMSHDLKTPLTVVNGYIESLLLNEQMSAEEQKVLLKKVHGKSQELIDLMAKFFDLAKLESGGDKAMDLVKMDVCEMTRMAILTYYDLLERKGIETQIEIPDQTSYIQGDVEAYKRILSNLISNAISYGYEGGIIGGVKVVILSSQVRVSIWDKGRGISEKYQQDVFERLYTLEDSRNKDYQGSGLGLTITKRLVENMYGKIELMSVPYEKNGISSFISKAYYMSK